MNIHRYIHKVKPPIRPEFAQRILEQVQMADDRIKIHTPVQKRSWFVWSGVTAMMGVAMIIFAIVIKQPNHSLPTLPTLNPQEALAAAMGRTFLFESTHSESVRHQYISYTDYQLPFLNQHTETWIQGLSQLTNIYQNGTLSYSSLGVYEDDQHTIDCYYSVSEQLNECKTNPIQSPWSVPTPALTTEWSDATVYTDPADHLLYLRWTTPTPLPDSIHSHITLFSDTSSIMAYTFDFTEVSESSSESTKEYLNLQNNGMYDHSILLYNEQYYRENIFDAGFSAAIVQFDYDAVFSQMYHIDIHTQKVNILSSTDIEYYTQFWKDYTVYQLYKQRVDQKQFVQLWYQKKDDPQFQLIQDEVIEKTRSITYHDVLQDKIYRYDIDTATQEIKRIQELDMHNTVLYQIELVQNEDVSVQDVPENFFTIEYWKEMVQETQ